MLSPMAIDVLIQAGLILFFVSMFLAIYDIPKKLYAKFRLRNRSQAQAKRHFVLGVQLLARARSTKPRSAAARLAKQALAEADKAVDLDPADAAPHILRSLVLELQGFKPSALDALDAALSPLTAESLSQSELGDALSKRAELKMEMNRRGIGKGKVVEVESAIGDLDRAVELSPENARAFCLLGECCEAKKMEAEARKAYENALRIEPESARAREALDRLTSSPPKS